MSYSNNRAGYVGQLIEWAEAHFFIGLSLFITQRAAELSFTSADMEQLERIRQIAERVANSEGLELVDVEFLGSGSRAVLRIFIDKPGGITVDDCQTVSQQVGTILDVEDFINRSYTLEVSSPGLDRKLTKPADYQRFAGNLVKVVLRAPRQGPRRFQGRLLGIEDDTVELDTGNGQVVQLDYRDIEKANLVVEFGGRPKPGRGPR